MHSRLVLYIFGFIYAAVCLSQDVQKLTVQPGKLVKARQQVTAIAIRSEIYAADNIRIELNGIPLDVPLDPDAPGFTYFLSLSTPQEHADIQISGDAEFDIFLINSGDSPKVQTSNLRKSLSDCDFSFPVISQAQWREGLQPPDYTRSFTNVKHLVVHHSAGSNTSTNYTQVVRDIYVYHTEVNGWSDIGYNYLIAQNGAIYAGRDPGDHGSQDNVQGAHFCGSNSSTMGVCLLGNYQSAVPTGAAWQALEMISTYKLGKENLDPYARYPHDLGNLGSIIGHRDGCSTLCPGEHVYERLPDLRRSVDQLLEQCWEPVAVLDFKLSNSTAAPGENILVYNNSSGYSRFQWVFEGGIPDTAYWVGNGSVHYLLPGSYDIMLIGYREKASDTLLFPDAIEIKSAPVIHPNPVHSLDKLRITAEETPTNVTLYSLSGKDMTLQKLADHTFQIPFLQDGVYFLRFKVSNRWFTEKLIILQ